MKKIKQVLSISEARKNIFKIADDAEKTGRHYTLTEKGSPKVVIMSAEDYESWAETLDVISEIPNLKEEIKETEKDIKSGKYKNYKTLDKIFAEEGYVKVNKKTSKKGAKV